MYTNLKKLRKAAGWSNADTFAKSIGLNPKTYRNYEQGVRDMGLDVASDICNALGCTLDDLVESYEPQLSTLEHQLVDMYRDMNATGQNQLIEYARFMLETHPKNNHLYGAETA